MGTLHDHLYSLFVDPKSLWSQIKQDAFNQIIENYVYVVITTEEERLKIVASYLELRCGTIIVNAFSKVQGFAIKVSRKERIYLSDLREAICQLKTIANHKPHSVQDKYLSADGRLFAMNLMTICRWLSSRVRSQLPNPESSEDIEA